MSNMNKTAVAD